MRPTDPLCKKCKVQDCEWSIVNPCAKLERELEARRNVEQSRVAYQDRDRRQGIIRGEGDELRDQFIIYEDDQKEPQRILKPDEDRRFLIQSEKMTHFQKLATGFLAQDVIFGHKRKIKEEDKAALAKPLGVKKRDVERAVKAGIKKAKMKKKSQEKAREERHAILVKKADKPIRGEVIAGGGYDQKKRGKGRPGKFEQKKDYTKYKKLRPKSD